MNAELKTIADRLRTCGCPKDVVQKHIAAVQALHKKRSTKPKQRKMYRVLVLLSQKAAGD